MEKISLLVGKHCMERSDVILSLSSTYSLFTLDLVNHDSFCKYPGLIQIISLSSEDMQKFFSFFSDNKILNKIGFSESSLLYIAKRRNIQVAVADKVTQNICIELGIETIKAIGKLTEMSISKATVAKLQHNKFDSFKVVACL